MTLECHLNTIVQEITANLTKLNVKLEYSSSILLFLFLFILPHLIFNHLTRKSYQPDSILALVEQKIDLNLIPCLGVLERKSSLYSLGWCQLLGVKNLYILLIITAFWVVSEMG